VTPAGILANILSWYLSLDNASEFLLVAIPLFAIISAMMVLAEREW
jgi:hypothetical protein